MCVSKMTKTKVIKNMIISIDTPPIKTHKYCLVNWLWSGITLTAQLDGTYTDDQGIHYEFNGKKLFHTKNNLIDIHVEIIISKDLQKIASPYPVNILISAWLSPKGCYLLEKELKEYDLSIFKYHHQYKYDSYLNNYIHYKKPVFEIKKYTILNKNKAVIRKWAHNYSSFWGGKEKGDEYGIEYYKKHGLKIHASCIKEVNYFYKILNFNKETMMKWLIFYNFLLPI